MARAVLTFTSLCLLSACAPKIGDDCETGFDCSVQSTRLCDQTQPGGYCTLPNCEPGTCPDEAVCVLFRPDTPRLSASFCMLECENRSDCRGGYGCLGDKQGVRRVLDGSQHRFCGQEAPPTLVPMSIPDPNPDAGMPDASMPDAGPDDAGPDDDAGD